MTQENEHVRLKRRSMAEIYLDLCEQRLNAAVNKKDDEIREIDLKLDRVKEKLTDKDGEEINRILKEDAENQNG